MPLFTYLYHEYAIGYLGQGSWPITKEKRRSRRSELWHALNFVRGKTLGLSEWSNTVNPERMQEHQLRMTEKRHYTPRGIAPPRTLPPDEPDIILNSP